MNKKINKKMISLVLTFMLITSLFSSSVFAEIAAMVDGATDSDTATACKAPDMPEIDGDLSDDGWNIVVPMLKEADGTPEAPVEHKAKFGLMWDEVYLYVGVDIEDPVVCEGKVWQGDSVEIYIDGKNDKTPSYGPDDMQIGLPFTASGDQNLAFGGSTSSIGRTESDILRACKKTEKGWAQEVAIPWEMVGVDPTDGVEIGFDVSVMNKNKEDAEYENCVFWKSVTEDGQTPAWNNTSLFGTVVLSEEAPEVPKEVKVTGVTLDKQALELKVDEAAQLKATVAPEDAANKEVKWTTSDANVATVDNNGNVKAIKAGSAVITAATVDGDFKANCNVTVKEDAPVEPEDKDTATAHKAPDMPEIDGDLSDDGWNIVVPMLKEADGTPEVPVEHKAKFGLMWDEVYLYVGVDIEDPVVCEGKVWQGDSVEIYIDGKNDKTPSYGPDDMQIGLPFTASGDQNLAFGGSTSSIGRTESDILRACKKTEKGWAQEVAIPWTMVSIDPVDGVEIGFDVSVMNKNKEDAEYENCVFWKSVTEDGQTPAWNNTSLFGTVVLSDKAPANVKVTGVTLDKNTLEAEVGQVAQLKATVAPQDATNKAVKWTSSDETVATVDSNGNVKAVKEGNAVITAATVDGDFKATCNVTVKKAAPIVVKGSIIEVTTSADFGKGTLEGAKITNNRNGEVELDKVNGSYVNKGVFTSDVINTAPFSQLIATWNTDTPEGTSVDIEAQALVDGVWSDWISWGNWSTSKERASVNDDKNSKLAGIWTDTFYIKNDKTANAVRFRVTLNSSNPNATPVLRAINGSIDLNHGAKMVYPEGEDKAAIEAVDKVLDVPAFSQMVRDPKIADSICSPTSATCVANYYLAKNNIPGVLPEESAWSVYDSVYEGFGNWAFSASYMGSFGLTTKVVQCSSIYDLKREIYNGRPVVISVSNARNENNTDPDVQSFPVIHGFPIPATWGHLITVTGFTKIDGKEYVCVNDSAAANDEGVKLNYLLSEFDVAWATSGRIAYFADDSDGPAYNPLKRLPAKAFVNGTTEMRNEKEFGEIELKYDGNSVDLSQANAKTIMVSKDGGAYEYIAPDANKNLWLAKDKPAGNYNVLVIAKDNKEYTVNFAWPQTGKDPDLQEGDLVLKAIASELSTLIGKEVTIKVSVENTLGVPLHDIKVEHEIPEGIAYVSDDSKGAYDSKTGVWTIEEIDAKATVELNIKVKATKHGQIDNMVSIYVDTLEDPIEDCATFMVGNTAPTVENYSVNTDKNKSVTGKVVAKDADNDELTYSLDNSHSGATVVVNPDGTWTYTPGKNYYGDDSFTVKVKDAFGGEAVSTITVKINNANTAPEVEDYKESTDQNTAVEGKIAAKDAEGDTLTYSIATQAKNGKAEVKADGTWVYTPNKDFVGEDKFAVKVDDGKGGVATLNIVITVNAKTEEPTKEIERLAGNDRYETSVKISSKGWEKSEYIVLANGLNYADSLCAVPLAKKYNAPIILTDPNNLSDSVKKEIERLGVKHVFVVGGEKVVTNKVVDVLKNTLKIEDIKRIGGKDRYETSALIAKEIGESAKFVVVSGQSYADALSIASIAGVNGAPILLTDSKNLPKSIEEIIKANKVTNMFIIGGDKVVSAAVEKQIKALANVDVKRLAGANRYDTNIAVVKEFGNDENVKSDNLFIATGNGFADALSVSALIAKDKGVLILTDKTLQATTEAYLKDTVNANSNVFVAGGEKVVSNDIIKSIDKLIEAAKNVEK